MNAVKNFGTMSEMGYLVDADRGNRDHMTWMGNTVFYDATHPGAQKFVWEKCKENYYKKGIRCFWLDEAEPEYGPYDLTITATMRDRRCSAATCIRWDMRKASMKALRRRERRIS